MSKRAELICLFASLALAAPGCTFKKKPDPGMTIRIAAPERIRGLDPAFADDATTAQEVGRAYEGLFQYHYLKRPYELIPALAVSMPEVSADGTLLTIRLRKGVLFQDDPCFQVTGGKGRELTADDAVYSFKRLADPAIGASGSWIFDGRIKGYRAWREAVAAAAAANGSKTDYALPIEGLKAVDRYTLEIRLERPIRTFAHLLAMPFAAIVAREAVEYHGDGFRARAVGTGPFRLAQFSVGGRLTWERNPTFRGELYPSEGAPGDREAGLLEDAGKRLPLVDRLVVEMHSEARSQWQAFLGGRLALAAIPPESFAQTVTPAKELGPELKAKGISLVKAPEPHVTHETFNLTDPVVGKSVHLRQALSLVVNPDPWIQLFHSGQAMPAQGPIPPGIEGNDPKFENPYRRYNLSRAKDLLARAGYPGGAGLAPLRYLTADDGASLQMADYLKKAFELIGVKLDVQALPRAEFMRAFKARQGQLWSGAWKADYPDAENFFQLFYGKNADGGPNDSGYRNEEFDRLFEKAAGLADSKERMDAYRAMTARVAEDCPWIFGAHRVAYTVLQSGLKNYKHHDFDFGRAKYWRLAPAVK